MRHSLIKHFGLKELGQYAGPAHQHAITRISDAVTHREMLAVVGEFGSGKSELVDMAARANADALWVYVQAPDRERLTVGGVQAALIHALGEHPKRANVAASMQLARLLGEAVRREKKKIVLVIDEAHRIHATTIRAIRDLRELRYAGHTHMLSVILIGQPPLVDKINRYGEVSMRFDLLHLTEAEGWMTYRERINFLAARFGPALEPDLVHRIAEISRGPLHMDNRVRDLMEKARAAGLTTVTNDLLQVPDKERLEALGISYAELAREAGVGKTTAFEALEGRGRQETRDKLRSAIDSLATKRFEAAI